MNERKADSETNKLYERVRELELRCGDTITLPGCDYAIPIDVSELILVKNNGSLPEGRVFSSVYQGGYIVNTNHDCGFSPFGSYTAQHHYSPHHWKDVNETERSYVFKNLTSIKNLKYCKNLKKLTICGASEVLEYDLSDLINLTHLSIIGNHHYDSDNTWPHALVPAIKGNNPQLSDISWITSLTNLEVVSFRGCNKLSDVCALKGLTNLWDIDLRDTAVKDVEFLKNALRKIKV